MKFIIASLLFLGQSAFAELDQTQIDAITSQAKSFRATCLDAKKITEVKEIHIFNKTAESMDKTLLLNSLQKELGLAQKPTSKVEMSASLGSRVHEENKVRNTKYELTMIVRDQGKEVCKQAYAKEVTETLK